jgi:hypothetical protein
MWLRHRIGVPKPSRQRDCWRITAQNHQGYEPPDCHLLIRNTKTAAMDLTGAASVSICRPPGRHGSALCGARLRFPFLQEPRTGFALAFDRKERGVRLASPGYDIRRSLLPHCGLQPRPGPGRGASLPRALGRSDHETDRVAGGIDIRIGGGATDVDRDSVFRLEPRRHGKPIVR